MSLILALLHAIPVLLAGAFFRSKTAVWIASIIMIIVGVSSGSPAFAAADILAVILGSVFALGLCRSSNDGRNAPPSTGKDQAFLACLQQRGKLGEDINSMAVAHATVARIQEIGAEINKYKERERVEVFGSEAEVLEAVVMMHQLTLMGAPVGSTVQRFMDSVRRQKGL